MGLGHWIKKHVTHKLVKSKRVRKVVDKVVSAPEHAHLILRRDVLPKNARETIRSWEPGGDKLQAALGKIGDKLAASASSVGSAKQQKQAAGAISASSNRKLNSTAQSAYDRADRNSGYTLDTSYRSLSQLAKAGAL